MEGPELLEVVLVDISPMSVLGGLDGSVLLVAADRLDETGLKLGGIFVQY